MRRTRTREREEAFARELESHDWGDMGRDVNAMAAELSRVIADATEKHFPLARVRRRSNEDHWITKSIRRLEEKNQIIQERQKM